jgi:hypothetical protein
MFTRTQDHLPAHNRARTAESFRGEAPFPITAV